MPPRRRVPTRRRPPPPRACNPAAVKSAVRLPPRPPAADLARPRRRRPAERRGVASGPSGSRRSTGRRPRSTIEPPQYDPVLSTLVSHEVGRRDPDATEKYLPNRVAQLKSKALAERGRQRPGLPPGGASARRRRRRGARSTTSTTKIDLNTNCVTVTLEGTDPARTAKQLSTLLEIFDQDDRGRDRQRERRHRDLREREPRRTSQSELEELDDKILDDAPDDRRRSGRAARTSSRRSTRSLGAMLMHKQIAARRAPAAGVDRRSSSRRTPRAARGSRRARARSPSSTESRRAARPCSSRELKRHDPQLRERPVGQAHCRRSSSDVLDADRASSRQRPAEARGSTRPRSIVAIDARGDPLDRGSRRRSLLGKLRESMPEHQTVPRRCRTSASRSRSRSAR